MPVVCVSFSLLSFARETQDETGEFMRMYWLDATEQNGTIYLIGKVAVPATSPAGEATTSYLSACVAVHGIEREVLVLPRCVCTWCGVVWCTRWVATPTALLPYACGRQECRSTFV